MPNFIDGSSIAYALYCCLLNSRAGCNNRCHLSLDCIVELVPKVCRERGINSHDKGLESLLCILCALFGKVNKLLTLSNFGISMNFNP